MIKIKDLTVRFQYQQRMKQRYTKDYSNANIKLSQVKEST